MSENEPARDAVGIKILFFGVTAEVAGTREIKVADAHGTTSRQLLVDVLNKYPRLASHKILFSINQRYGSGNEILRAGDEIAIFTAVSGG
jgi:molybdopterin synthase sulfur carrier subunit